MRILFVSNDLIAGNLAYVLKKEGHEVKLYVDDKKRRGNFNGLLEKTVNWQNEISWVGKKGLIIFDDVGFGREQDALRRRGYTVFGGGLNGEKLETDRAFGAKIFKKYGMKTLPLCDFSSVDKAINFLKKNTGPWVIKQNANAPKSLNYVGRYADNSDTIHILKNYKRNHPQFCKKITLQKKIEGIEIATSRYFNGKNWIGPIEMNIEHKKFLAGNIGPTTSEMGTIAWYDDKKTNKLFKGTLQKLKPFLSQNNYRGVIDINCIVNKSGIYPLEATARLGSPIIHLQNEAYKNAWGNKIGDLYCKIAKGENVKIKMSKGFGIVILIAIPPFPYAKHLTDHSLMGQKIYLDNLSEQDMNHLHFEEVSYNKKADEFYISDERGYILYVTSFKKNAQLAKKAAYNLVEKIHIPKMIYRNDIGFDFIAADMKKLKTMGYL